MTLTVGLSCLAVAALLLVTPIHLDVDVQRERAVGSRVHLSWLFGLVRFRIHRPAPAPEERKGASRRRPERYGRATRRLARGALQPDLRARSITFARDIFRAVRPRDVRLDALIGMDDPADTGMLWSLLGPVSVPLSDRGVRIQPTFDQACFRFRAGARVRLVPGQLLVLTLAFLSSPPMLRHLIAR